ncbi:DMT family transporter [Reyranella sp.]|uniref:DMT family transporter n=1 Tax=Reyranella sp. TaxID=1929291 RepID=UPI0037844546
MIDNRRGILAMSASVLVFIINDALMKLVAETVPAVQAIGVRGAFATLWCGLALLATGTWRQLGAVGHPRVLLRGVLESGSAFIFLIALFHIPFGIATAVGLSSPLMITVLAVLILGEDVRWRRWSAVAVGFAGVLMVIQPRPGDLNAWTWVALAGTFCGALRDVLSRDFPRGLPTLVVSFATAVIVTLVGFGSILVEGWQPMSLQALGYIVAASLLLAIGYQLVVLALRSGGELSVIGTFRYSSILWALAIGYVVWDEVPNALALTGIAVIVASGIYILHRERMRR